MLRTPLATVGAACLASLALAGSAHAASGPQIRDGLADGSAYLRSQQQDDGIIAGFGGNTAYSALSAAGTHPADAMNGTTSAQQALVNSLLTPAFTAATNPSVDGAARPGQIERAILEAEAAGVDSSRVSAGQNLLAQLAAYYNDGGHFNIAPTTANPERRSTNLAVFGLLALTRTDAPAFLLDQSVRTVAENQHNDGGWDFGLAEVDSEQAKPSGIDLTGAAIASLCEAGVSDTNPTVRAGVNFLASQLGADGGLGDFPNVSSNAWAVSGLNACGIDPQGPQFTSSSGNTVVDFLLDQQNADGGFFSAYNADPNAPNAPIASDVYSTQDALRPLGGESFSAAPPARAAAADPRTLAPPAVADGTTVPIALAVDDGSGGVSFCRVTVPSGASLATLLATAAGSSAPAGCATGGEFTGGQLSKLNGQTGTWAYSTGGGEQVATNQAVRFGDFVALRRTSNAVPAVPGAGTTPPAAVPAAVQAKTTPTGVASKSLKVSAKKRVVSVSLSCARDNRSCEGKVFIVYGKSTLGRREFTIGGGKTTKLNVKLFKSGVKRLGGKARKVKVNTFSRDGAGVASTSSRTVTLTPTK